MDNAAFWKLIDASRLAANGDAGQQLETLGDLVGQLEPDDTVEFDRIMTEYGTKAYDWGLWGAAYVIGGGCSDDGFMDFRGWLISRGEQVFEAALRDPDSLADVVGADEDCQVEGFAYIAPQAWEDKTGRPGDEFPMTMRDLSNGPTGQEWEEDDLDARFPKLAAKFN